MSQQTLKIRDLHYSYPDGCQALKGLSFTVCPGESVGIVGANGAGKSTLLLLLLGVLFPQEGQIDLGDVQVTKKTLPLIREKIGMVFQNPDNQLFMSTVYDDVAFGPRNYKLAEQEVAARVRQALEMVGILHLQERAPFRLSGGEKRAAALASVLSLRPQILVLDEPTAALDPQARRRILNLLQTIACTKIITSHDLDLVLDLCERTIVLQNGQIAAAGLTPEILGNEQLLTACGLELPLSLQNCPLCRTPKSRGKLPPRSQGSPIPESCDY
ncbi:MAG TPA: ABC transporter ATP-binding protein [Desulfitobacteriaceae bacterium]|nr:ABC transporter ATP-binding protein [Desulfitobacteriaceae bacterium]